MNHRTASRLAWGAWAVAMTIAIVNVVLLILARNAPSSPGFGFPGFDVVFTAVFASVGAIVASRQYKNPIGWLLLAFGVAGSVQGAWLAYALYGIPGRSRPLPGAEIGAWLNAWIWFPSVAFLVVFVPLLFPDGRLLSPRWRRLAWPTAATIVVGSIALALQPGPLENFAQLRNPIGVDSPLIEAIGGIVFAGLGIPVLLAALSVILRYRRAAHSEREQIKWLVYAAVMAALAITLGDFYSVKFKIVDAFVLLSILAIPLAVGVAILRYRLYDIDRIISRTVSYGLVTALLLGSYIGLVVVLQRVTEPLTGGSDLAVAGSTLIVAAAFGPIRRRVQTVVDRRFNRARYDSAQTIEAFASRLREQIDLESLGAEIKRVVAQTMEPASVFLWLRGRNP